MNKVPVSILGKTYELEVAAGDELLAYSLAEYVEKKITEVQQNTGIVDTQKLAILAALNIADDYLRLKDSKTSDSGILDKKADELIKVLDKALTAV